MAYFILNYYFKKANVHFIVQLSEATCSPICLKAILEKMTIDKLIIKRFQNIGRDTNYILKFKLGMIILYSNSGFERKDEINIICLKSKYFNIKTKKERHIML